jgi:hypothetical protein
MFAFKAAHEQNITLNEFMNQMLRSFIDRVEAGEITRDDAEKFVLESRGKPWPLTDEEYEEI